MKYFLLDIKNLLAQITLHFKHRFQEKGVFLPFLFSFLIPTFIQGVIQTHRLTEQRQSLDVHSRNTKGVLPRGRNVLLFLNMFYTLANILPPLPIKLQAKKKLWIKFLTIHLKGFRIITVC